MANLKGKLSKLEKTQAALVRPTTGKDGTPGITTTQAARKDLMEPCATKEALQAWMRKYIDLDFPDQQVDPDSTGSPLDHIWRIYHAGVTNDRSFYRRVMMYAARASYKTLGVAALELLAMLHMDRSVVHLAAIEQQAGKAQEYLRRFLSKEGLDEFAVGNNKRSVAVVWAKHKTTGDLINLEEWREMDRVARRDYVYHVHYSKVIVNTPASSNSDHVAFFVVDEVDLIRFPIAYEEAKLIPEAQVSVDGTEQPPITVLTSSRKSAGGLVQKEIDEAEQTKTAVWHWNILDVSRRCPDEKHRPDLPMEDVFIANAGMRVLRPPEYAALQAANDKDAAEFEPHKLYWGCLNNCPIRVAAGCKGKLANVTSKAKMLKDIEDVIAKFIEVSAEMAEAQVMCWKPGNIGSIYKGFSRKKHMLTPAEMWTTITGEPAPPGCTKQNIVDLLIARKVKWSIGMDFGFTHMFAVCLFAIDGRRAFLIDAFEVGGLELNQKIELCDKRFKAYKHLPQRPVVWPDPAYPSDIKTFRRNGWVMRTHDKDVVGGINAVRNKLSPPLGHEPEMFMLKGDDAGELMAKRLESYKWKTDNQGRPLDEPDDFEDDLMDATRYSISNEFKGAGKVVVAKEATPQQQAVQGQAATMPKSWMKEKIQELTGGAASAPLSTKKISRGGFFADMT